MISVNKAKQLKKLGLVWIPKCGDWYKADYWPTATLLTADTTRMDNEEIKGVFERIGKDDKTVWLPRLDQLLNEIEKFNVYWEIERLLEDNKPFYSVIIGEIPMDRGNSNILEDAIADALIWILEKKVGKIN